MSDLINWTGCDAPSNAPMTGRHARIVPFVPEENGDALWDALGGFEANERLRWFGWPVMERALDLVHQLEQRSRMDGWQTCIFQSVESGAVVGMANYMRTDATNGVTEVGAVAHGAAMARSPLSTEVHFLMARRVFDELGYRRYEWKLNNRNEASHEAARRFGFTFEGVFRQHQVARGKNRDTAWYSMIDQEWPIAKAAFEAWLDPANFGEKGNQIRRLADIRAELVRGRSTGSP